MCVLNLTKRFFECIHSDSLWVIIIKYTIIAVMQALIQLWIFSTSTVKTEKSKIIFDSH